MPIVVTESWSGRSLMRHLSGHWYATREFLIRGPQHGGLPETIDGLPVAGEEFTKGSPIKLALLTPPLPSKHPGLLVVFAVYSTPGAAIQASVENGEIRVSFLDDAGLCWPPELALA